MHDFDTNAAVLRNAIETAYANRNQMRMHNVTGTILWQQMNRSTEYLSKYIGMQMQATAPARLCTDHSADQHIDVTELRNKSKSA
jgi:hypothetical protein